MKIRNISGEDRTIGYGFFGPRTVKAGDTIDVPDEVASNYLDTHEACEWDERGFPTDFTVIPSDVWEPAEPAKASAVPLTEQ